MPSTDRRWCVIVHATGTESEAEIGARISNGAVGARMLAADRRTMIAAPRGAARDPRWPRSLRYEADVRRRTAGPLVLHAAMRIAGECPDAIVATLGPDRPASDETLYLASIRRGAEWVSRHPSHVYAVVEPTGRADAWGSSLLGRARPARLEDLATRAWRSLSLVFRVDTILRLLEVFQPSWWAAARACILSEGRDEPVGTSPLESFDLMRDVLVRCPGHLRLRPILATHPTYETSPSPSHTWPYGEGGRG